MKKRIGVALIALGMLFGLSACGTPFTCDICNEEKTGRSHTSDVYGYEIVMCHECYSELEEWASDLK